MQLMIDLLQDTPTALRLVAAFINEQAGLREVAEGTATPVAPPAPPAPLAPPAPATTATAPGTTATNPTPAPAPVAPPAPVVGAAVALSAASSTPIVPAPIASDVDFDSAGVPFDGRIHQASKNKKKDGTWKLRKGVEDSLVAIVMRELAPRIRVATPAASVAPATPEAPTASSTPPIPNPADIFGKTPLPAGASAPVAPPAPTPDSVVNTGAPIPVAPPVAAQAVPDPFRALIAKIAAARNAGKLTTEESTQCYTSLGVPSLQALNTDAFRAYIPQMDAMIDSYLAVR